MTTRPFDTLEQYRVEIQFALQQAARRVDWFDIDLSAAGAAERASADALKRMLAGSRLARVRLLLHDDNYFHRHCPRLASLLAVYGHAFEVRLIDDSHKTERENWLLADGLLVRRYHADAMRGEATSEGRTIAGCRQRFESMWEIAVPPSEGRRLFI
ncbi:DUF7931 domain-containing protein [Chitinimonas lacunae]|uniref:DUF7931 domain-containing protein n=1 Tax=Chitinimonas lacunae TaxID=1963018 RepID=A0ABV8MWW2_9NEIS